MGQICPAIVFKWLKKIRRYFVTHKKLYETQISAFINSFFGTQPCSSIYIWSRAVFCITTAKSVVATETIWLAKPEIFIIWVFTGKVCRL